MISLFAMCNLAPNSNGFAQKQTVKREENEQLPEGSECPPTKYPRGTHVASKAKYCNSPKKQKTMRYKSEESSDESLMSPSPVKKRKHGTSDVLQLEAQSRFSHHESSYPSYTTSFHSSERTFDMIRAAEKVRRDKEDLRDKWKERCEYDEAFYRAQIVQLNEEISSFASSKHGRGSTYHSNHRHYY